MKFNKILFMSGLVLLILVIKSLIKLPNLLSSSVLLGIYNNSINPYGILYNYPSQELAYSH